MWITVTQSVVSSQLSVVSCQNEPFFGWDRKHKNDNKRTSKGKKPMTESKVNIHWFECPDTTANEPFVYSEIKRWIDQEHTLISNRMGWLISSNAFLFIPLVNIVIHIDRCKDNYCFKDV